MAFEELNDEMKEFIGSNAAETARIIGERTAEVHLLLAGNTTKEFAPEEFSLHYQRSLFFFLHIAGTRNMANDGKQNGFPA